MKEENEIKRHNQVLKEINEAFDIPALPSVSKTDINSYIINNTKFYNESLRTTDIKDLTDRLFIDLKPSDKEFRDELYKILYNNMDSYYDLAYEKIIDKIDNSSRLNNLIIEILEKQKRILKIYEMDHIDIMDKIEDATRISKLPVGLTKSKLAGYLSGNTIIYPKGEVISSKDFLEIVNLLLENNKFDSEEIKYYLKQIAQNYYPENADEAYNILYTKLSSLPKIKYYVEEINLAQKKQNEFIKRGSSNVNLYLVPNPNTPEQGGLFYNCYINRASNLDLEEILPLNLSEIIPDGMDVDSIEWYVQKHFDPTFKAAGGIILNKDETIGNANIFKPNKTDKVEIEKEDKEKYDSLNELSIEVKELISKKKKSTDAFLNYQKEIDEELSLLEEKIDSLMNGNQKVK